MPNTNKSAPISTPLERIGAGGRDDNFLRLFERFWSEFIGAGGRGFCCLPKAFRAFSLCLVLPGWFQLCQTPTSQHPFRRHWSALEQEGGTKSILGILKPTSASWCVAFITSLSSWVYQNHCLSSKSLSFIKITVFITYFDATGAHWSRREGRKAFWAFSNRLQPHGVWPLSRRCLPGFIKITVFHQNHCLSSKSLSLSHH